MPRGARSAATVAVRAMELLLPAVFAVMVLRHGVPVLRHDWFWPRDRGQAWSYLTLMTSGWSPLGLGAPTPNPTAYFVAIPAALMTLAFGPAVALFFALYAIGFTCTWSIARLALRTRVDPLSCIAAQLLILFNPWVWNKVVAGHIFMILAYGAVLGLCVTVFFEPKRTARAAFFCALTAVQLQFYLPAMALAAVFALRQRRPHVPLAGLVVGSPTIVGLLANRSALEGVPYLLSWQMAQSVPLTSGALLAGSGSNYVEGLSPLIVVAMVLLGLTAAIGVIHRASRRSIGLAVLVIAIVLFAAGGDQPLGGLYLSLVGSLKWTGVYRELYDVLGAAALGYVCLSLRATCHLPLLRYPLLFCGAAVASMWVTDPVTAFWPRAGTVPILSLHAAPNSRYALFPAFQPLSYRDTGSGADPDAVLEDDNVSPLNEYLPAYPEDVALAQYERNGTTEGLAALSVSVLYERPHFRGSDRPIAGEPGSVSPYPRDRRRVLSPALPELGVSHPPAVGTLTSNFGAGNVFVGDLSQHGTVVRHVAAPDVTSDPRADWVSLRLVETTYPRFAEPLGGSMTSSTRPLVVPSGDLALVNVRGRLFASSGAILAENTRGYRWVSLHGATVLRCAGACAVAATGHVPGNLPLDPASRRVTAVAFRQPVPWLAIARLEGHRTGADFLRYDVRYDSNWIAIQDLHILPHVRVDGVTNGWYLPSGVTADASEVLLLHVTALAQCVLEALGFLSICWFLALCVAQAQRRTA